MRDMGPERDTSAAAFEFSRPLLLSEIGDGPRERAIEADASERDAVAALLGIPGVKRLAARLQARRWLRDGVALSAEIDAVLIRECVVTLDHFDVEERSHFHVRYMPPEKIDFEVSETGEIIIDVDAEDEPEPLMGDLIDLGEAVVQHLALTLDPYPRKPDASLDWDGGAAAHDADGHDSPFTVLAKLAKKK